jgi:immune inhibitor A
MTATVSVSCKSALKDRKDLTKEGRKEIRKELKERSKEIKDLRKDTKELAKERKDAKDRFEGRRPPFGDRPSSLRGDQGGAIENLIQAIGELEERVSLLELGQDGESGSAEPFIEESLRPDLIGGPDYGGQGDLRERMQAGDRDAKAAFDTPSP